MPKKFDYVILPQKVFISLNVFWVLDMFACNDYMKAGFVVRVRSILRTRMRARNFFTRLPYFPYPKVEHIRHHRHPYLQVITYFGARHIYLSRQKSFSGNIWRQGWLYECAQFFGHERGRAIFYSALLHRYKTLSQCTGLRLINTNLLIFFLNDLKSHSV